MHVYCTDVLHLSDAEAFLRIAVARAGRKFPVLLVMLGDGRLHLSGIALLAPHLTEENLERVLARAAHKSKRKIEELVAELAPKPDVPATIRKLPTTPPAPIVPLRSLRPDVVKNEMPPSTPPAPPPARPVLAPLAPARYKVQFTASAELRDKLERLQALTRSDLAEVIEAAVTEKLERLESRRFGKTSAPRKSLEEADTSPDSRYIAAPIRRAVCERDGFQCTFIDANGKRCTAREGLEFHHRSPYGRDGDHSVENLCLMCHAHNAYLAELDYGKDVMDRYRRSGSVVREKPPVYGALNGTFDLTWSDQSACSVSPWAIRPARSAI